MGKNKPRSRHKHYKVPAPGTSPGLYAIDDEALKPVIVLHTYNDKSHKKEELKNINNIEKLIQDKSYNYWFDIKGLADPTMFETLYSKFDISRLVLEDITSSYQRPKLDEYDNDNYIFSVSRHLYLGEDGVLCNDQISFILSERTLITFQETYSDCFEPVRKRLEIGKGNIRIGGSSYLMYAIMDVIVDNYFSLLNFWGEELDAIEDRLYDRPDKRIMYDTQAIKRSLITIRKIAWPERDKLNDIIRTDSPLISDLTKTYMKDAYDHCIQIIDFIESLKEIASANIDMNLSIISNRMNEIMKVLTIISSIFIPLTFIAGIYGMNFSREDPVTGKVMPDNMPELYSPHGYIYTWIVMGIIAVVQVIYFWRKGWFK
ncbi:magnesium/cobalt transporter CorA [Pedobacter sp. MC2016-05]|uniref:magnesium/cobalt transporter CorA n=1 Tax=Pedobacter sp. MC2016-05 TaxID=2994474 RepID=UPI0022481AC6|nr:magnesium/cobalt transporter CorA [Pedobacter sp. MC2016-05]MCX2474595.1 magnesium/cobalt transporter CorA [Pedobacter sp. MC2016-05]